MSLRAVFVDAQTEQYTRESRLLTIAARMITAVGLVVDLHSEHSDEPNWKPDYERLFAVLVDGVLEVYPASTVAWKDLTDFAIEHRLRPPAALATEVLQ